MSKLVAKFHKNTMEEVRASLTEYKGKQLADIRVWVKDKNDETKDIPTKKGLTITIDLLPELREAVEKLEKAAGV